MSIRVQNIAKRFGSFVALDDVTLDFPTGELVGLLGPSGCGKTTLLRIIAGLESADHGQVFLDGEDASTAHVRERQVGFVFQHYALFRHMTVFGRLPVGHNGFQSGAEALGFVRPHELDIETDPAETAGIAARVERVLAFGPTARVELSGAEREASRLYEVELSHERVAALNLANGQRVRLKPARIRLFAPEPRPAGRATLPAWSLIGLDGEGI